MALWFDYQLRAVEAMFAAYCPERWGAKEPAVREELKVFEVCVVLDKDGADEFVLVLVQPTAVVAYTKDEASLHGVRLADAAQADLADAPHKPLDVSRLTGLVRPFV